jgi:putative spermidine/putrescine transport system permease protein
MGTLTTAHRLAAGASAPAELIDPKAERASWLQVAPLVLVLSLFFGLPMLVVLAVSFFDYDHADVIPTFILDNYVELFQSEVTFRVYASSLKFALIVWAVTLVLGFNIAFFLVFHVRSLLRQIGAKRNSATSPKPPPIGSGRLVRITNSRG